MPCRTTVPLIPAAPPDPARPLHPLDAAGIPVPARFPSPFREVPHPLARLAAEDLMRKLPELTAGTDAAAGKMFGVLVVRYAGALYYLAAFSGYLKGRDGMLCGRLSGFVPPVCDLSEPGGFFKRGEAELNRMNRQIAGLENAPEIQETKNALSQARQRMESELECARQNLAAAREERNRKRAAGVSPEENAGLIRESQHGKAELRRLKKRWEEQIAPLETAERQLTARIAGLRKKRQEASAALELQIFDAFRLTNRLGEQSGLRPLFRDRPGGMPPGGTAECAAPRLLHYAVLHKLDPVCLAEFWWGASPAGELRTHGRFYPACAGKCRPILPFQLRGIPCDPFLPDQPPGTAPGTVPDILYEDPWLLAVDKPAGLLSLPGRDGTRSCLEILQAERPGLFPIHRLDRDTSGLLLFAKDREAARSMQAAFRSRDVEKQYIAHLERIPLQTEGIIDLPLAPDWDHRPRQRVCPEEEGGKPARTRFRLLDPATGRILFLPETGRTHQLRIHAAHPSGLGCPILGDPLYGSRSGDGTDRKERMYLHASRLVFRHPFTGVRTELEAPVPF